MPRVPLLEGRERRHKPKFQPCFSLAGGTPVWKGDGTAKLAGGTLKPFPPVAGPRLQIVSQMSFPNEFPKIFFSHASTRCRSFSFPSRQSGMKGMEAAVAGAVGRRAARDTPGSRQDQRVRLSQGLAHLAHVGLFWGLDKAISTLNLLEPGWGHLPVSLRSSFAIHLEKVQCSPQLPLVTEVPVPADGAASIMEGKVTPKAGTTFIIQALEQRATLSAVRRRRLG